MVAAVVIYGALAVLFTWPMVLHLQTGLFGGGDAYHHLWGFWWFDNAIRHVSTMWSCPLVFHPYGANLVLDDWPLGPNLVALIMRRLGLTLIGSYNASLLVAIWLNALSVFLLVRAVLREWLPALVSGLFFAFAPFFWGRLHGHLGFMHAYPLALVALCTYKTQQAKSPVWAVGVGGSLALAVWSQYYYAVYAAFYLVLSNLYDTSPVSVRIERRVSSHRYCTIALFILGVFAGAVAIGIALNAGTGPPRRGVGDGFVKYVTPMVIWWLSWLLAFGLRYRLVLGARPVPPDRPAGHPIQLWGYTALPLILLLPVVMGVAQLAVSGDLPRLKLNLKPEFSGAYALSALFPNIYHSLWGLAVHVRLASWSLLERGSIGLGWAATALIVGTRAYRGTGWWTFGFCVFFALSLGPFLELAPGLDQGPILPFWLLRYVPVMSEARVPSRWIALALVAASVLVGYGVQRIRSRRWRVVALGAILFEALVIPLNLAKPVVPEPYHAIARDQHAGALLELPVGACDGRGCWGDRFPAELLYYQTVHHKPVVGGYLSRIPERAVARYRREPLLQKLTELQKMDFVDPSLIRQQGIDKDVFFNWAAEWGIGWVVLDRNRASVVLDQAVLALLGEPLLAQGHLVAWRIDPVTSVGRGAPPGPSTPFAIPPARF